MISYSPFWETLKKKNISAYSLLKNKVVSSSILQRMRDNKSVTMQSIHDLCMALDCNIEDIVEIKKI